MPKAGDRAKRAGLSLLVLATALLWIWLGWPFWSPEPTETGKKTAHEDSEPLPPGAVARLVRVALGTSTQEVRERMAHREPGNAVASLRFTPDGRQLIAEEGDEGVIWDLAER